jgi:LPXTG-motif cell wall-anchored protein
MYKSGKKWAFAGLVTTYFAVLTVSQGNLVHADTNTTTSGAEVVNTVVAETTSSSDTATTDSSTTTPVATPSAEAAATPTTTTETTPATTAVATPPQGAPKSVVEPLTLAAPTMTANGQQVTLSGQAEPNATITATVNGLGAGSVTASGTGTYSITVAAGKQVVLNETTTIGETASVTVDTPSAPAATPGTQTNTNAGDLNDATTGAKDGVKNQLNNGGGLAQGALFNDTAQGADNTATANLGDQETADAAVSAANKEEADKKDSGYVKTVNSEKQQASNNDGWDEDIITVDGMEVKDNQQTTAADIYSDQGALASAYTDTDDDGVETIADTIRHVDLHSQVINTGIAGRLIGGDTANTAVFKVAEDLRELKVGTWTVVATSNIGVTVQNDDTGEFFAITDNSNNTSTWNVGDKIENQAVVHTKYTGAMIDQVANTITTGLGDLVTIPGQIANTVASGAGGVLSGIIGTLGDTDSYAQGLAAAKAAVDNDVAMEHYLMDNGVRVITLEDVAQDGHVLTVTNDTNAADAIGNMVTAFAQGWINDVKNYAMAFLGLLPDADGNTALESAIAGGMDNITGGSSGDGGGLLGGLGGILDPIKDAAGGLVSGGATSVANGILDSIVGQTDGIVDSISQGIKDALTGAVDAAGDASWGASQSVVVPVSFKDPDFKQSILKENMDPAFADGKFKAETIGVSANLFRQTDDQTPDYTTSTTIAYQVVNKTALDHYITAIQKDPALIQKAGSALTTAIYVLQDQDPATQGKTARTSSQKDVDEAIKAIQDKLETVPELTSAAISGNPTDGYAVTGEGTPNADLMITDPAGTIVGTGTIGDDGKYTVNVDGAVPVGTLLTVTPSIISPVTGDPVRGDAKTVTVPEATDPVKEKSAVPTDVTAKNDDDNNTHVTGSGVPGATVKVTDPSGKEVGTGTVGDDGKFDVEIPDALVNPDDKLDVTQTEPGKDPSDKASTTVPDDVKDETPVTDPVKEKSAVPTDVTAKNDDDNNTHVTGSGVPGATVKVTDPSGKEVGTGTVGDDGKFDVEIPDALVNPDDKLDVTQTEPGKDPSDKAATTVPEDVKDETPVTDPVKEKSAVPTGVTAKNDDDNNTHITGSGVPGATVKVTDPSGKEVGTGTVGDDGKFDVEIPDEAVKPGDKLDVTQTEPGKDPSDKAPTTVPDDVKDDTPVTEPTKDKSAVPIGVVAKNDDDNNTHVTGSGVPGATVKVTDPSGKEVGTGTVGDDGKFDIKIPDGLVNSGDKLGVTQTEPGKDPSDTTPVTVPEDVKDNTPITETSKTPEDVKISRTDGGVYVEGTGEPGATVEVKTPDGDVIGTGKVDDNGHFKVQVPEGAVKPGDKLDVTETEPGKKPSAEVQVNVPEEETSKTPEDVKISRTDGGVYVEGTGEPGATVEVKTPDGDVIGTGKVDDNGHFKVQVPEGAVKPGDKLGVTETEPGKKPSAEVQVNVPEEETSKTPEDVKISRTDGGVYVEGTGEPGATVEVKTPDGDVIGTGKVDDNGHFKVQVPEGAVKPGDKLGVTETEPGKKPSAEVQVDVPNATTTTTQTAVPNSNQGDDSGVATPTTLSVTDDSGNVTPTRVKASRGTGATLPATGGTGYATGSQDNQKSTPVSVVTAGVQPAQQAAGASGAATASLPKTGDTNEVAIAAFGGALVLGLIGLAGSQRKREN